MIIIIFSILLFPLYILYTHTMSSPFKPRGRYPEGVTGVYAYCVCSAFYTTRDDVRKRDDRAMGEHGGQNKTEKTEGVKKKTQDIVDSVNDMYTRTRFSQRAHCKSASTNTRIYVRVHNRPGFSCR